MRRGTVAIVAVGLLMAIVAEVHARPGGGRAGGGRSGPAASGRGGNGPSRPAERPSVGNNIRQGSGFDNVNPGSRGLQNGGLNAAGENLSNGELKGTLEDHLNVLPEPRRTNVMRDASIPTASAPTSARSSLKAQYAPNEQPFTPQWYGDHPNAWQYTHPHADAWAVATTAGAAAWLGWDTVPAYGYGTYYSETPSEEVAAEADALASNGSQEVDENGEWLNIGTYALAPKGSRDATLMLTLAVDKDGILRGTYFDLISNSAQTIQGAIDKESRRAAWRVGEGQVTFQTTLNDLTADTAAVSLQFENGQTALWSLARQNP